MATLTLTIPAAQVDRIQDAICIPQHGYTGFLADGTTPQSKADFLKTWVIKQVKKAIKQHESELSAKIASESAIADVETDITIT